MDAVGRDDRLHAQPVLREGERLGGNFEACQNGALRRPETERDVLAGEGDALKRVARSQDGAHAAHFEDAELVVFQVPCERVPDVLLEHEKMGADAAARTLALTVDIVDDELLAAGDGAVDEGELFGKVVLIPPGAAVDIDIAERGGQRAFAHVLRFELFDGGSKGGIAQLFVYGEQRFVHAGGFGARQDPVGEPVGIRNADAAADPARDVDGDARAGEFVDIAEDGALRTVVFGCQLARVHFAAGEQRKEDADEGLRFHAPLLLCCFVFRFLPCCLAALLLLSPLALAGGVFYKIAQTAAFVKRSGGIR